MDVDTLTIAAPLGHSTTDARRPLHRAFLAKSQIADEVFILLPVRADVVGVKAVVGISHGDAGHDDLILRDVLNFPARCQSA